MATRETVIIVAVLGVLSAIFVLFMVGVTRALDPNPNREAYLQRDAFTSRPEDVKPRYDVNDTAIVSLKVNQKGGPVLLKEFTWFGEVKIDLLRIDCDRRVVSVVLRSGETTSSCMFGQITLLNMTTDTATFKFVESGDGYFCCPYCWHMYRGET